MTAVKRDTEYIFGYPPLTEKIDPPQIWQSEGAKRPIGFYLHIPFCRSICKYCPFNKRLLRPPEVSSYLKALKQEIDLVSRQPSVKKAVVAAAYLGGGTPTALSTEQLVDLLAYCQERFSMAPAAELTIEANPDSTTEEKMAALLKAGVNRISFGVQSFDDRVLAMLGCRHRSQQAVAALKGAFAAGFDNVGLDLLYRLPGQNLSDWQRQLETALSLSLSHITTPELAVEPGTPLYEEQQAGKIPARPDETRTLAMYERSRRLLIGSGYRHYNLGYDFALEGKECLYHRMNWQAPQQEVVGLGAGAYSYINGAAYFNLYSLADYIESLDAGQLPVGTGKRLSPAEKMARFMVQGVYFVRVSKQKFSQQFGRPMDEVYGEVLGRLAELGWIVDGPDEVALTREGHIYVNNVSKAFYEEQYGGGAYGQQ
jgi:oxygen-independent coproporphyrinogen-3 oxidase